MSDSAGIRTQTKSSTIPQRWATVFLAFFGLFNAYGMRICLSIAITQMTLISNNTAIVSSDETCSDDYNNNTIFTKTTKHLNATKYEWSELTQGLILSSFYWGYIVTCLVGGAICNQFGGKHTLGLGILFTSLLTLLTPYSIEWGGAASLIVLRVAMGLGEGPMYPAISDLLSKWISEDERSIAGSIAFSGAPLGTIFGMLMSGVILQHSESGWPVVFYFYGIVGIISFLLNTAFCFSRPSENPYISDEELKYLKTKLKNTHTSIPSIPWQYIWKSSAVWALIIATFGSAWGFLTIVSDMPKFMSSVLKLSAEDNGYMSSIPYFLMWICGFFTSWITDKLIAEGIVSITTVRKVGCTVSLIGPAIFLVAASYAGCNGFLVVVLQSAGLILMGCSFFSLIVNALDLSPNYASSIMGLANGFSIIGGMVSPCIVGLIASNQRIDEWRLVFWIVGAIFVASSIVFLIYGSGKVQEWNDPAFLNKKRILNKDEEKEGVYLLPGSTR